MTSSLVGSEMCIRDRNYRVGPLADVYLQRKISLLIDVLASGTFDPRYHSVSYTHLTLPTICSV
eukprot:10791933-Prorocentrum_lima.AAC.1